MVKKAFAVGGPGGLALALLFLLACSNTVSSVIGSATLYCNVKTSAGEASCLIQKDVATAEQSTLQNECTSNGGTSASSCPTTGLVGCCTQPEENFTLETCYYAGTASQLKTECSGTWTTTQ
ncbi:MAG: hypothetical protein ACLQVI_14140 [Polyangiaceae bacterium]|jgi:hypothetical protein